MAQLLVFNASPQRPDRINKGQIRHLRPRKAEIENFVHACRFALARRALEFNCPVADEQDEIFFPGGFVIFQRLELRLQSTLGQQHFQQIYARERGSVAENLLHFRQRFLMRENHAVDFAERRDGDTVQNIVAVVEQNLGDADERGVEFIAPEHFGELGGRGEDEFALDAARERHGVQITDRADAEFWGV